MTRTAAFTIISPNYRHFARVLMASLARHHPDWDQFVLLCGGEGAAAPLGTVSIDELRLPHQKQFCFRYTLLELNTAVKPWMFEHLFARGYECVIYFDPDIVVYSPLAELDDDSLLTLTPHITDFIGGDQHHHPSEQTILQAGTYNLGFLAVSRTPELARFLNWWKEKLEFQCVVDTPRGLFVDQKWLDLAPGLFDRVRILRHDGYNVAYWNLAQRMDVIASPRLRFFHFSGFDPAAPEMVSRHDPRQLTSGDARKLFDDYVVALHDAGYRTFKNARYSYGFFNDGSRVFDAARIAYRNSAELQNAAGEDPFAHPELFRKVPSRTTLSARAALRTYRMLSRARPLVKLLPRRMRTSMREFLLGRRDPVAQTTRATTSLPPGLNVIGYVTRDTGVGESARLCANACERASISTHLIDIDSAAPSQSAYRASIVHVNADQVGAVKHLIDDRTYNIGVWHWELPELPDAWISAAEPFDEIWAPSAFVQSAISAKVTIPVVHMPHGIEVTDIEACSPQELGVPRGRFVFLFMFDLASAVERKNPFAAIEAFRRAAPRDAALLIKTSGASEHRDDFARIREIPNVYVVDRMLSRARVNGLLASCDAVVSLHRSEGFGLILAEAMFLGKPVIATGWSGNVDFMDSGNSCPVAYDLVTLARSIGDYHAGQQWAEPDVDHAAHLMRRVVDDGAYRAQIGERARRTIRSRFSPDAAGMRYRRRLEFLGLLPRRADERAR